MYVSCLIFVFYLVWCISYVRINITLSLFVYLFIIPSYAMDFITYPILYYFIF